METAMLTSILVLIGFLAILAIGYGALNVMAGGMSDAPQAGSEAVNEGVWIGGVGLAILAGVVAIGLWRWLA